MSVDHIIERWKEVRAGFIGEVSQIPEDQFSFRPTAETRAVGELVQHVVETQKILVGEACRSDSNLQRQSFGDHIKEYASEVDAVKDKNGLLELMSQSMNSAESAIRQHADTLNGSMKRFDGKTMSKLEFLQFAVSHEMYHRGQFTVYERLLNIEPALTQRFKKFFTKAG